MCLTKWKKKKALINLQNHSCDMPFIKVKYICNYIGVSGCGCPERCKFFPFNMALSVEGTRTAGGTLGLGANNAVISLVKFTWYVHTGITRVSRNECYFPSCGLVRGAVSCITLLLHSPTCLSASGFLKHVHRKDLPLLHCASAHAWDSVQPRGTGTVTKSHPAGITNFAVCHFFVRKAMLK